MKAFPNSISPEAALILCCARLQMDAAHNEYRDELLRRPLDWQKLTEYAIQQGIVSLLYRNLSLVPTLVPSKFLTVLHRRSDAIAQQNLSLTRDLINILRLFEQRGILVVPLKGPVLGLAVYGNVALRECSDIDIIVHTYDVTAALETLNDLGYVVDDDHTEPYHYVLQHRTSNTTVELHWQFTQYAWSRLDFTDMATRLDQIQFFGENVRCLSRHDIVLHLCLHGAKHFWRRLRWLCDIAELTQSYNAADWQALISEAKRQHAHHTLCLGLLLAEKMLDATIPACAFDGISNLPTVKSYADWMAGEVFDFLPVTTTKTEVEPLIFCLADNFSDKRHVFIRILRQRLQPTPNEQQIIALPGALRILYYPLRIIRVMILYRFRLWKRWVSYFKRFDTHYSSRDGFGN